MENPEEKSQKNTATDLEAAVTETENDQKNVPADFEVAIKQTGFGKYNYLLALLAFPGMLSSILCSTTISYVLPAAQCDLELTNFDKGVLNAVSYGGLISGGLFWGFLSDNMGRRRILIVAYFLDGVFSLISSLAQSLWFLQLFRFAVGFANSGPYGILITYLLEFHSNQYRSRVLMFTTIFVSLSLIVVPSFAWLILPQLWSWELSEGAFNYHAWNVFIAVCSLPSFIAGFMVFFFKETPKFLMSKGQHDEAMKVLKYIYSFNTGKTPDTYPIKKLVDELSNSHTSAPVGASGKSLSTFLKAGLGQMQPLLTKALLPKLILVCGTQMITHFGMNTLRLWMPQIFSLIQEFLNNPNIDSSVSASLCEMITHNKTAAEPNIPHENVTAVVECTVYVSDSWIYVNSMIIGAVCSVISLAGGALINTLGKRTLTVTSLIIAGLCGLSIYWCRTSSVITVLFSLYQALIEIGLTCILGMAIELFPTTVRTLTVSLAMIFGRMGSLTGNLIFPVLLDLSCEVPFFLTSSLILCCSFVSFLFPAAKKTILK